MRKFRHGENKQLFQEEGVEADLNTGSRTPENRSFTVYTQLINIFIGNLKLIISLPENSA